MADEACTREAGKKRDKKDKAAYIRYEESVYEAEPSLIRDREAESATFVFFKKSLTRLRQRHESC